MSRKTNKHKSSKPSQKQLLTGHFYKTYEHLVRMVNMRNEYKDVGSFDLVSCNGEIAMAIIYMMSLNAELCIKDPEVDKFIRNEVDNLAFYFEN